MTVISNFLSANFLDHLATLVLAFARVAGAISKLIPGARRGIILKLHGELMIAFALINYSEITHN
jgi:hypothetical protein